MYLKAAATLKATQTAPVVPKSTRQPRTKEKPSSGSEVFYIVSCVQPRLATERERIHFIASRIQ